MAKKVKGNRVQVILECTEQKESGVPGMYRESDFFNLTTGFKKVFLDTPLSYSGENAVKFNISPQPVFNKDFELLSIDIRKKIESGYRVLIFGEKESQLNRLKSKYFPLASRASIFMFVTSEYGVPSPQSMLKWSKSFSSPSAMMWTLSSAQSFST